MSVYINSDLIDMDEQSVEQGEPSFCDDTEEVSRISRNIEFDWQRPQRKLTGRERYLALCQKLGLKPKEPKTMSKKRNWRGVSDKVAKDKTEIYNSREWKELRIAKLRSTNGLCEECMKEGIVTSARCVHHVVPIETARTKDEMRRLALDCGLQGLKSLCFACHARIHKELGSNTAKIVRQRAEARQDRWADKLMQRFMTPKDDEPPTT